jgi:hypothetical protein
LGLRGACGPERFSRGLWHEQRKDASGKQAQKAFKAPVVQQALGAVAVAKQGVPLGFAALKGA